MDLISRQAAIDALIDALAWTWSGTWSEKAAIDAIKNLPSVDAIPVVRCKDCIHFTKGKDEWGSCFENPMKMWRDTDYCSWGEMKTDESN